MATRAPKVPKINGGTDVALYEAQFAEQAAAYAKQEATGGQSFTLQGGVLAWQDMPMPNNEIAGIILDSIWTNIYYGSKFDPDNPSSPLCFAYGREELTMVPHEAVVANGTQQHTSCTGCPKNQWASADTGRGKACSNTRRLAIIPAGTFDAQGRFQLIKDPAHYAKAEIGFLKPNLTSLKGYPEAWGPYVKQIANVLKRPPHGVITRIKVVPDKDDQFHIHFTPIEAVPGNLIPTILERHAAAREEILYPLQVQDPNAVFESPKPATKALAGRPPAAAKKGSAGRAAKY
jgi:hypothetical protein